MSGRWTAEDSRLDPSPDLADVVALLEPLALDPGQETTRRRMLDFAEQHPDALLRSCTDGHFTGSALVVDVTSARVLLLFHRKLQRWLQPGGHADGDGNLPGVAWREASEETAIAGLAIDPVPLDLDIHRIDAPNDAPHVHLDVRFLVRAPAGAVVVGNDESEALRWIAPAELDDLGLDDGTLRLIDAGLQRARAQDG